MATVRRPLVASTTGTGSTPSATAATATTATTPSGADAGVADGGRSRDVATTTSSAAPSSASTTARVASPLGAMITNTSSATIRTNTAP